MADIIEKFHPTLSGGKHCADTPTMPTFPKFSEQRDYIVKGSTGDDAYPATACRPYVHYNVLVGTLSADLSIDCASATVKGNISAATAQIQSAQIPTITGVCSGNKISSAFDIPHVKDSNKRIRHIVAEGPEPGIYIRGRLTGSNVIELPEYWDGLIDPETITVTLTQIASSQDLIVDSIPWGKSVVIKSGNGTSIDCFYEVWAARWLDRKDHSKKLHVVYEGTSSSDYPGLNDDFVGVHYDNQNIIKHNEDIEL